MQDLFEGIPLDRVSTSMTINATASILLALYVAVARRQGVAAGPALRHGAERHPQGVHRARDLHLPAGAVDAAGHRHLRVLQGRACRAGTRSRSPATTCARRAAPRCRRSRSRSPTGSPTCRRRVEAGLAVDEFAPQLSFFFNAHNNLLEEVAKFRAARRLWARIMRERFGARDPRSLTLRFHAQTAGSMLTAQQPENNVVRVDRAGARGGARRQPVAAHELDGRGARAADRGARRGSRCARSRSSRTSRAWPTPSIRSAAPSRSSG